MLFGGWRVWCKYVPVVYIIYMTACTYKNEIKIIPNLNAHIILNKNYSHIILAYYDACRM